MTFYICPPSTGTTDLATVLNDVNIRLRLLYIISQCDGASSTLEEQLSTLPFATESDSFIEFTPRDSNAHFLLRVVATGSSALEHLLLRAEPQLLIHRLRCSRSLHVPLLQLQRDLQQAQGMLLASQDLQAAIIQVCNVVEGLLVMRCVAEEQRCSGCSVTVPWPVVPQLVARRCVVLTQGQCRVPCHLVLQLLAELFTLLLRCGLKDLVIHRQLDLLARETPHLHAALTRCVRQFLLRHQLQPSLRSGCKSSLPPMAAKDVSSAALLFPPCMLQLQRLLHRHRRLQHHQRYRYTVFLKGVGMPLDQNIAYWQEHYSCSAHHHATCEHSWPHHGARYIYSLRHAYGLEGRKLSARPHSCQQLQSLTPQPGDCGGCPFAAIAEERRSDDGSLGGDFEDDRSEVSLFSKKEASLLGGNSRDASGRHDGIGSKDGQESMKKEGPSRRKKNLFEKSEFGIRSSKSLKKTCLEENSVSRSSGASKLIRCNSLSMEISGPSTSSSSQYVLMDISNSQPNMNSSRDKNDFLGRSTAHSLMIKSATSRLKAEPNVKMLLSSIIPSKDTLPASSQLSTAAPVYSTVSSHTQRSPTTSGPTTHLRRLLKVYGLSPSSTEQIIRAAQQGHPALACRMTLACLLEAAQDGRSSRAGGETTKNVTSNSRDGNRCETLVDTLGDNGKGDEGKMSHEATRAEAEEDPLRTGTKDVLTKVTSGDCRNSCSSAALKRQPKTCSDNQAVVQDNKNQKSTNFTAVPKCNRSSKSQNANRAVILNMRFPQNVGTDIPTHNTESTETLQEYIKRKKFRNNSYAKKMTTGADLNAEPEMEQKPSIRKAVEWEKDLSNKGKFRKLEVRTKSVYEPHHQVKAPRKRVDVFDGKSVNAPTIKRNLLKGSDNSLQTAKDINIFSGGVDRAKKIENFNSVAVDELPVPSSILPSAIHNLITRNNSEPKISNTAAAVPSAALTVASKSLRLGVGHGTELRHTVIVNNASSIDQASKQCGIPSIVAITPDNGPSMGPCNTPIVSGHKRKEPRMVSSDAPPDHSKSWHQRALDPSDVSLSFVSPAQFYALVIGLKSKHSLNL